MRQATAVAYYDAATAIVRRDWTTYKSYRTQLVTGPFSMFVSMCLFYYVSRLIEVSSYGDSDQYFSYIVVGLLTLMTLQSTLMVAGTVRGELMAGTFERLLLSPLGSAGGVASMMLFPWVVSILSATVVLMMAAAVFGLPVNWSTAWLAYPVALLGSGAFAALGMLFAATVLIFKRMIAGAGLLLTLISFTSGVYFPVTLLPSWVEWVSEVQPFTPAIQLLRHVLIGAEIPHDPWMLAAKIAAFVVVMIPLGFVALTAATRVGQRTGTIIEY